MRRRLSRDEFSASGTSILWRPTICSRVRAIVFAVSFGGFFCFVLWISDSPISGIIWLSATWIGVWLMAIRPWIGLDQTTIMIVNPVTTRVVKLSEAAHVRSGYGGIDIELVNGSTHRAWAVQKSNLMSWLGHRVRSDEVVDRLNEAILSSREYEAE